MSEKDWLRGDNLLGFFPNDLVKRASKCQKHPTLEHLLGVFGVFWLFTSGLVMKKKENEKAEHPYWGATK